MCGCIFAIRSLQSGTCTRFKKGRDTNGVGKFKVFLTEGFVPENKEKRELGPSDLYGK